MRSGVLSWNTEASTGSTKMAKKQSREDKKREDAKRRARLSRIRAKVKAGKATSEERAELARGADTGRELEQEELAAGVTVEAPTRPDDEVVEGGLWNPSGAPVEAAAAPPVEAAPSSPAPLPSDGAPPALDAERSPGEEQKPAREVTPEEQARGAAAIGTAVAICVSQSVAAAKRLAIHQRLPAPLVPLIASCDERRTAAIASVVAAATASVLNKYVGGAVRYTDEAIVVVALAGCVAVNVAAAKLPKATPEELAQQRELEAMVAAAEAEARDRAGL